MTWFAMEQALDRRHAAAQAAFATKDIATYHGLFGVALRYRQIDGTTISRAQLMRDVAAQFARIDRATSRFTREALRVTGDEVCETLVQTATVETRAFGFLRRIWTIERRGNYFWAVEDKELRIIRVDVLSESISASMTLKR
ncbi:DUF4440 domain-containing protein [Sphingomonas sp.]|uniref:DUF4440 domain-containing protein n=1 Tax=Sphingomonas sp. TaxID=28214 RepID=UPI003B3BA53E